MDSKKRSVVCFGTGPAFKGGMSNYNTSLAKAISSIPNTNVHIVSWSQQYPSIIPREFKDKVSKNDFLKGTDIQCTYITNYNKPSTWKKTAQFIASLKPEKVIVQWSIAIQGLPIGRVVKRLKKLWDCEVVFDMHFVVQKEKSKIDTRFTKFGIKHADTFVVHALNTFEELKELFPSKHFFLSMDGLDKEKSDVQTTVIKLFHPIYDLYEPDPKFDKEKFKKEVGLKKNVFLYFGFIRKYKGLHNAIRAFDSVRKQRNDVSFLICGELFWNTLENRKFSTKVKKAVFSVVKKIFLGSSEDEKNYNPLTLISEFGMEDSVKVFSEFIPNEDVHKYFQVADAGILFYLRATPSGIESLNYNFNLPVLTSRTGHFPETIQDGVNGYMVEENTIESMVECMLRFLDNPIPNDNVNAFKENLSWARYANAIMENR